MAQEPSGSLGPGSQLISQKEYADRRGWSKQYVNQLVKKGRIPLQGGRIDPEVADSALARSRDPAQDRPFKAVPMHTDSLKREPDQNEPPASHGSFTKARTVREHYRALRERLEYEQLAGKLIPMEAAKETYAYAAYEFRNGFQAAAIRIGNTVATRFKLEEQEVIEVVTAEINATLTELCRRFREKVLELEGSQPPDSED